MKEGRGPRRKLSKYLHITVILELIILLFIYDAYLVLMVQNSDSTRVLFASYVVYDATY